MSLIFTDTFVGNDQTEFTYSLNTKWHRMDDPIRSADATARTNGYLCRANPGAILRRLLPAADQHVTLIVGRAQRWRIALPSSEFALWTFLSDATTAFNGTTHVTITISADLKIRAYRGTAAGTLLGTSAAAVMPSLGSWYYVEAQVTLSDTVGTIDVTIDGVNVLSLSGLDTKNAGTKTVLDAVECNFGPGGIGEICDVYFCNGAGSKNNDFLNCPKIVFLTANGNGVSSQGVGSDGNSTDNYLLSEAVGYVDLVNTGDKDTYTYTDASVDIPTINEVHGALVWSFAEKTDAAARSLIHVARSGASEADSASAPLLQGVFSAVAGAIETKPGGGAWTVADLNAMEFGIKAGA